MLLVALQALASSNLLAQQTSVSSVGTNGLPASGASFGGNLSADGNLVTMASFAGNLVTNDSNGTVDVFVRDRSGAFNLLVSRASSGVQSNGFSFDPMISSDGRFVVFGSQGTNLVAGDSNGVDDVFVRSLLPGTTVRVSVGTGGLQGNGHSRHPRLSGNGQFVAFMSEADNLVAGDSNGHADVFVHDRESGSTQRVSVTTSGLQANGRSELPSISADGRLVSFVSSASNLVSGDSNGVPDVFLHDRATGATTRVSVGPGEAQANAASGASALSADGRVIVFESRASNLVAGDSNNLVDIFARVLPGGSVERLSVSSTGSEANGASRLLFSGISSDGRYVVFDSEASNLAPADTNGVIDAFVRDRQSSTTQIASTSSAGALGNGPSTFPSVSSDGRFVSFSSEASNLVSGDANFAADAFVRDAGVVAPTALLIVPDAVASHPARACPMTVSWVSEGTVFCRAEIPNAATVVDQCARDGGLPARGSFWTKARCPVGQCPDPNDPRKLPPSFNGLVVQVCQGLLGLAPPQSSISLRLVCTSSDGTSVSSDRTVTVRAPLSNECPAPLFAAPAAVANPQPAWGGGTLLSGAVSGAQPGTDLSASVLYDGQQGQTEAWVDGNALRLRYRDHPGVQPPQITETVTVAVSDGGSTSPQTYTFTVPSSHVFGSGFEPAN